MYNNLKSSESNESSCELDWDVIPLEVTDKIGELAAEILGISPAYWMYEYQVVPVFSF